MRTHLTRLAIAVLVCTALQPALAEQPKVFADAICPSAIPAVKAIGAIADPTDAVKVADAAGNVMRAYKDCAAEALASGAVEPKAHYAQTRAASYEVVYGRALLAQGKYDEAHAAFEDASKLSGLVADWVAPAYGYTNSNKNPERSGSSGDPALSAGAGAVGDRRSRRPVQVGLALADLRERPVDAPVAGSADQQLLGREARDHLASVLGDDELLLDTGCGPAVAGRPEGLQREDHVWDETYSQQQPDTKFIGQG